MSESLSESLRNVFLYVFYRLKEGTEYVKERVCEPIKNYINVYFYRKNLLVNLYRCFYIETLWWKSLSSEVHTVSFYIFCDTVFYTLSTNVNFYSFLFNLQTEWLFSMCRKIWNLMRRWNLLSNISLWQNGNNPHIYRNGY